MSDVPYNLDAMNPYRIDIDTRGVAGFVMPSAIVAGMSYEGVRPHRLKRERQNLGGSGDKHLDRYTLFEFQQIALEMDRNNGLSCRLFDAAIENICGDVGFTLASLADGDELQARIERDWWEWLSNVCDPAQELHGVQRFANIELSKHQLGGSFIQWDDLGGDGEGQFRLIEGTRCVTPVDSTRKLSTDISGYKIVNGIARDSNKAALYYWFADDEPENAAVLSKDGRSYPAKDIIHYYTPRRESLTRGLPVTAAVVNDYDNVDDVLYYESVALKASAACSINIETNQPGDVAEWMRQLANQGDANYSATDRIEEWVPGSVTYTKPGETPKVLQSTRPAQEVQEFIVKLIRKVGLPLAVPYEWLMLDFSRLNLGTLRVVLQVIQRAWKKHQFNHGCVLSKIFRKWIERQIANRRYPDRPDVRQHAWNTPTWPSPQPVQDATANKIAIEGGWGSHEDAAAQNGKDIERVLAQRERYAKLAPKPQTPQPGPSIDKNGNPAQNGGKP